MVSEPRKQSMARMETDYSKDTHFRWKTKWRLKHMGALGLMGSFSVAFLAYQFENIRIKSGKRTGHTLNCKIPQPYSSLSAAAIFD